MRNFGVIRSVHDRKVLRLAPNFDNNQVFTANPSGVYSDVMLKLYILENGYDARSDLKLLCEQAAENNYLSPAAATGEKYLLLSEIIRSL